MVYELTNSSISKPIWMCPASMIGGVWPRSVLLQALPQRRPRVTSAVAAAPLKFRHEQFGHVVEAPRCVGGEQHEAVAAAFVDVLLHLVGDVGRRADGYRCAHRDPVDLRGLAHRHRSTVLGFEDRIEKAADALHVGIDDIVVKPEGGEVE